MTLHFAMIAPPLPSHMYAAGALGRELISRGHRATFIGVRDVQPTIEAQGVGYQPIGEQTHPPGQIAAFRNNLEKLDGMGALKLTMGELVRMNRTYFAELPGILSAIGATALISDQAEPAAGTIAEHTGLPWTTTCIALPINREPDTPPYFTPWRYAPGLFSRLRNRAGYAAFDFVTRRVRDGVQKQREHWNLRRYTHPDEASSQSLQVAQTIAEFDFPRRNLPATFHYTGPFRRADLPDTPFPWERLPPGAFVYASLGTFQNRLGSVFETIAQSCAQIGVPLVLSLGGGMSVDEVGRLRGNPLVVPFAPQMELLKRAAVFVTHGGLNSVHESLLAGVPSVVVPILGDQGGVAARVLHTGAGLMLPFKKLTAQALAEALRKVLDDPSFRERAQSLKAAMDRSGGVREAAALIEQNTAVTAPAGS